MSAAAFRSVALFVWSRNRAMLLVCGAGYVLLLIVSETPPFHALFGPSVGLLLFAPMLVPLSMFLDSGRAANLDLTSPEGHFPRSFFVLPAAAHQLVLPFMLYAALLAATQWLLAKVIIDPHQLDLSAGGLWLPALATSFVAWMQAIMWTPARHRFVRVIQLLVLLSAYVFVFALALNGAFSGQVALTLGLAQFPVAYAFATRGVARCRRGEPGPPITQDRDRLVSTFAPGRRLNLPHFASPFDAQLWMERRIHRWAGKSALVAVLPAALLALLFMAKLSGADERDAEAVGILGKAAIYLLFIALGVIGISTGISFGSFRYRMQWQHADAYLMPPYFAALPFATGDFAWAKMRAATQRMLWVSVGVVLICAVVAKTSGIADAWMTSHAAWRDEYGPTALVALAALPPFSFMMLVLAATASVVWLSLLGRSKVVFPSLTLICFLMLFAFTSLRRLDRFIATLPVILPILAVVKVGGLVTLISYVGSRKLLGWFRLAIITVFWAATAGTLMAWITWYAPEGLISPMTTLCAGIVVAPVLGAVAAPLALAWNRAR